MGNLIFLLAFLLPSFALAQDVNLIKNGDFEARLSRWSKTGSSTLAVQSALPLEGDYSADWDASATGEFLRSNTYTVQEGMKGRRCSIEMEYLWDSGVSGEILMNVDDGTNNVATVSLNPTTGGVSAKAQQSFDCPTSGSLRFELESTANAASIRVDKVYLGSGKNTVQISQANFVGGMENPGAATCSYNETTSTANSDFVDLGVGTSCAAWTVENNGPGVISAVGTNDHRLVFTNMQPGNYVFVLTGSIGKGSSLSGTSIVRLSDGTNSYQPQTISGGATGSLTTNNFQYKVYNPSVSTKTFKLQISDDFAGTSGWINQANMPASWKIYRFPLTSAEAMTIETSGWLVDANIVSSTNASLGGSNVTSYTEIIDANSTLTNNSIVGAIPAQIACSATNPSTGTTCAAGSESIGVAFNVPYSGPVEACVAFTHSYSFSVVSQSVTAAFQIVETPNNAQTILQQGNERISSNGYGSVTGSTNFSQPFRVCSTLNLTAGLKTLRLMYEQAIAGAVPANNIAMDGAVNIGQRDVKWTIKPLNQQMPAPLYTELQNLVKSSVNGIKIYSAIIANGGTPTVGAEHGGDWISSLTDNGAGDTTINFQPGIFTVQPSCTCIAQNASGDRNCIVDETTAPTSSLTRIQTGIASTGADLDLNFHIICTGP